MDIFMDHSWLFIFGLAIYPRITLLVSSVLSGGLLWWLGWIFTPHLLVAFLSLPYWDQNPVLMVIAWMIALGGTSAEAKTTTNRRRRR